MINVELLSPQKLTDADIRWLTLGCQRSIDTHSAVDQVVSALAGKSGIYRVSGDAEGVFVLTQDGDKMLITAMAGKGFIKHFPTVHAEMKVAAAACGARQIAGYTTRPGLSKLYLARTKARVAEYFVEDLL